MPFDSLPVAKLLTVREPMIHMPDCVVRRNLGGSLCCGMDILAIKTGSPWVWGRKSAGSQRAWSWQDRRQGFNQAMEIFGRFNFILIMSAL
ncbi:hypothetical protein E5D57_013735 [Metarhizium anisopliae]|nr:hypothetical protein E5D57_013735 [Metarhizium anisopliae]